MYVHEIYTSADFAGMRHYRQATMPSGLIKMEEIGQTAAHFVPTQRNTPPAGLIVPPTHNSGPTVPKLPSKSIECKDIADLVDKGVSAWRGILSYLGASVLKITLAHAEMLKVQEATTESGLLLPAEPPQIEFLGYASTPDEIEALEAIANRVNGTLVKESVTVGNYL